MGRKKIFVTLFSFFLMLCYASCESKVDKQARIDRKKIVDYLKENNLEAEERPSGLFYIIENPGSGGFPDRYSTVTVRYTGYFLDGHVFKTTDGGPASTFNLQGDIAGWREGLPLFQKGGSGKLLIPSGLAYGPNSHFRTGIPNNSVLIFEFRLLDFTNN